MQRLTVLALVACAVAVVYAQPDTTGKQFASVQGFTFGSNVGGYLAVSKDVCDYEAALKKSPADWAAAEKIYTTGGNSKRSDGTIRTLKSLTGPFTGEPFFDLYAKYYGSPQFMDQLITSALGGTPSNLDARLELAEKGVETNLQWLYLMHELDEAADKIRKNQLSASSGAPHNIDETWAIYVGEAKACGLFDQVNKRGNDFGTMGTCAAAKANELALSSHLRMYRAAQEGNLAAFERARKDMERVMLIQNIQNVLRYSQFMDDDLKNGKDPVDDQAEGYTFFRTIAPLVNMTNPAAAKAVMDVMTPGTPIAAGSNQKVAAALQPVYARWNLTADDLGSNGAKSPLVCVNATSSAVPARSGGALAAAAAGAVVLVSLL